MHAEEGRVRCRETPGLEDSGRRGPRSPAERGMWWQLSGSDAAAPKSPVKSA